MGVQTIQTTMKESYANECTKKEDPQESINTANQMIDDALATVSHAP